jgi:predicted RNA-binding Zn-ribbon protein involved in translation (DUF1610 family)
MNKATRIALVIVLFVAAGVIYYTRAGGVNDLNAKHDYNAQIHCLACNNEAPAKLDVVDVGPFACPKCGKKAAWHVWECTKCNNRFTPPPGGDPPRQPAMPTCPKCGSSMTGRFSQ